MSFDYNYKFWVATQKDLDDVLKRQEVFKRLKPIEDKSVTHYLFAELYARYVQLVNKLGYIYHHTLQVQKRDVIKELVEATSQRLLELKSELKNLELSEFVYIDKTLIERRLTPDDIVVWTPKYFPFWRPTNVQEMIDGSRKMGDDLESKADLAGNKRQQFNTQVDLAAISTSIRKTSRQGFQKVVVRKELMDVVTLIQAHERARVGRLYLTNIRYNPDVYKPRIREDEVTVKYQFTYKPTQTMLVPVRRTRFDANYYAQRRDLRAFNYYVKPVYRPVRQLLEDELSETSSEGEQIGEEESDMGMEEESSVESESSECYGEGISETDTDEYAKKILNLAAQRIQSFWRGYRDRKTYKALLERKSVIYGMAQGFRPKSKKVQSYEERVIEEAKHRTLKEKYDDDFLKFCEDERARILRVKGPWIMEDISDNIRAWFREFYDKLNCFHPYPEEVKGGTLLLLKGETMDIYEYEEKIKAGKLSKEQKNKIREKEKEQRKKVKEKLKKEKLAMIKQREKLKAAGIFDISDEMEMSKSIVVIENTINKYKKEWADIDEKLNNDHAPIKEWITSNNYAKIHEELQVTVDELMRLEYELLQRALAKDKKKKYKPPKKKMTKAKKGKKTKVAKDMTADRSIESLYYELQEAGIVKTYPKRTFDDFIAERNHCAFDMLNVQMKDTPPFKGEVKDVLREYVLGMGPLNIAKPKAVCLAGPSHSGKKLLCDILATEIGAVVLDIGPENTAKYQSDLKYFVHIITKMAKILQPTILYIRDVHRVFWKKIPKEHADMNPRLLQSQLKKNILKPLKKEDNVILLATTDAPWTANSKMKKLFQKIILVPKTEYATSFALRRNVTLQTCGIPRDLSFSALALVTRDYTTGDLIRNIEETLNLRRRMELVKRPLDSMEFIDNFLRKDTPHFPPELKEWEKYAKWYRKVSKMAKSRAKMMKMREELISRQNKNKPK